MLTPGQTPDKEKEAEGERASCAFGREWWALGLLQKVKTREEREFIPPLLCRANSWPLLNVPEGRKQRLKLLVPDFWWLHRVFL